jgi:hypothetical protein
MIAALRDGYLLTLLTLAAAYSVALLTCAGARLAHFRRRPGPFVLTAR